MSTGSSTSVFVSSLIFNLIIFSIFIIIFITLRNKYLNVYRPRTTNHILPNHLKAPPLTKSSFGWIVDLISRPKSFIIQQVGIDGYFFLRYLKLWAYVGFFGGLILWPILFAVNATGGGGKTGFDIISYSNNTHKWRVFAQLFCSWFFFGFVCYVIYVELVYYTGFRHNLQCTPFYSSLPSSKILLVDNVSEDLLYEDTLRKLFPSVQKIVITRDTSDAKEIWDKRNKLVKKLESAFVKVLNKCINIRSKVEKKESKGKEVEIPTPINDVNSYIKESKLPTYKYKPIIGKSKKVFNEGLEELSDFNQKLDKEQEKIKINSDDLTKLGSIFLEFPSHLELQRAYQAINKSENFKKSRKYNSFFPDEVIWKNAGVGFVARQSKRTGAKIFLTLMIIFWAIPVAVVGCISNINFLTEKVHFLRFINNMPSVLMGIITGILPSVLLSILMSLVPPIIRYFGKLGGCMTFQELDYWTQQWFFAFQVIQVFLVTTCTSAASSVVVSIINDPSKAMSLLAENLPPASNFYISYMLLQGLSISSGILAQIVGLILSFFMGKLLDKTPRQKWNRLINLSTPSWGTLYGSFGLFNVIMLCYSIIAPIIIAFTSIAFMLIYVAQLYTFVYVSGHTTDNRGRNYPLALFEVFVGIYLAEICLLALFVMQKNWACVVLEALWLILTVCLHLYYRIIFESVLDTVPISAIEGDYPIGDFGKKDISQVGENYFVNDSNSLGLIGGNNSGFGGSGGSGDSGGSDSFGDGEKLETSSSATLFKTKIDEKSDSNYYVQRTAKAQDHGYSGMATNFEDYVESGGSKSGLINGYNSISWRDTITRFFHPKKFVTQSYYKSMMPQYWNLNISNTLAKDVDYKSPEISDSSKPTLWIAKDTLGISEFLIKLCQNHGVACSDEDAVFNEKGKVVIEDDSYPPDYESSIMY
ncbi:hypothetical protein C6P40_003586 [Pichia californica]|uniref:Phosphate metabolism protein 7 n=1 Tax=Pichia californica TaxID=460514 RepID=A0A9P7BGL0_9ASCO|nr:hypothetical protein C6P42_003390 [[Candida] californica]KAG0690196.1 hypothetical protein C6P40_003586 [[Candida] californica]